MGNRFYDREWRPAFEIERSDGEGFRSLTMRDAKKLKLYPSVTTYLDCAPKPALTNWLVGQPLEYVWRNLIDGCVFTFNGLEEMNILLKGFSRDSMPHNINKFDFVKWAKDGAEEEKAKAPRLGTKIHKIIEKYSVWQFKNKAPTLIIDEELKPWVKTFNEFFNDNKMKVGSTEKRVGCHKYGYAGTVDFVGEFAGMQNCVIDYKTTKFKNGKPFYYFSWGCQIAAYAYAIESAHRPGGIPFESLPTLVSVAIDSLDPKNIEYKIWEDKNELMQGFLLCRDMWCSKFGPGKGWDPVK